MCVCWQFCGNEESLCHAPTAVKRPVTVGNKDCAFVGNTAGTKSLSATALDRVCGVNVSRLRSQGSLDNSVIIIDVLPSPMQ